MLKYCQNYTSFFWQNATTTISNWPHYGVLLSVKTRACVTRICMHKQALWTHNFSCVLLLCQCHIYYFLKGFIMQWFQTGHYLLPEFFPLPNGLMFQTFIRNVKSPDHVGARNCQQASWLRLGVQKYQIHQLFHRLFCKKLFNYFYYCRNDQNQGFSVQIWLKYFQYILQDLIKLRLLCTSLDKTFLLLYDLPKLRLFCVILLL